MRGMDDSESLQTLREVACAEANLPPTLASRVQGTDIGTMRRDALQLAQDLGYAEPPAPPARDELGRFKGTTGQDARRHAHAVFNDAVRAGFGYPTGTEQSEPPVADLGVGKGAGATPMTRRQPTMNDIIRSSAAVRSGAVPVEQLIAEGPL
jgi:hypothetical protein